MKLNNMFLGLCIIALIISEVCLVIANQQKRDALNKLNIAQQAAEQAQAQLSQIKASSDAQAMEDMRLNAENKSLSKKLSALQNQNSTLSDASQQLSAQLTAAQQAAQQQQQQQQEQLQAAQTQEDANRNTCMSNLRAIEVAKNEWALENGEAAGAVPTAQNLLPYFSDGNFPVCPDGGIYTIGAVGTAPSCSIHGSLPTQ
ncbi:MAG: hypothetical protein ACLQSR_16620 [Limisphaerales bacterium]